MQSRYLRTDLSINAVNLLRNAVNLLRNACFRSKSGQSAEDWVLNLFLRTLEAVTLDALNKG